MSPPQTHDSTDKLWFQREAPSENSLTTAKDLTENDFDEFKKALGTDFSAHQGQVQNQCHVEQFVDIPEHVSVQHPAGDIPEHGSMHQLVNFPAFLHNQSCLISAANANLGLLRDNNNLQHEIVRLQKENNALQQMSNQILQEHSTILHTHFASKVPHNIPIYRGDNLLYQAEVSQMDNAMNYSADQDYEKLLQPTPPSLPWNVQMQLESAERNRADEHSIILDGDNMNVDNKIVDASEPLVVETTRSSSSSSSTTKADAETPRSPSPATEETGKSSSSDAGSNSSRNSDVIMCGAIRLTDIMAGLEQLQEDGVLRPKTTARVSIKVLSKPMQTFITGLRKKTIALLKITESLKLFVDHILEHPDQLDELGADEGHPARAAVITGNKSRKEYKLIGYDVKGC